MKPRVFGPAILSGVLLWAAFFPLNLGPVAFFALVPWLTLVRAPVSARRANLAAYLGGMVFFALATQWVRVAHPLMYLSWLGIAVVCPLFWLLALFLLRRVDQLKLVSLAVSVPVVWVALEYARAHFPVGYLLLKPLGLYQMTGFGWYSLGYSQHEFLPLVQVADLGGVYVVSFVVAAVNGLLAEWALRHAVVRRWLRWPAEPIARRPSLLPIAGVVGLLVAGSVAYGISRLAHAPPPAGPRVAILQGSVPQAEKNTGGESVGKTYVGLCMRAFAQRPQPDLIVWPETCCPVDWFAVAPGVDPATATESFRKLVDHGRGELLGKGWPTNVLYGLTGMEWDGSRMWKYNSALLVPPAGTETFRYDKMHLVPFGEYVPLGELFPFLSALAPYTGEYSCRPGDQWTRFPVTVAGRTFTFGCLICYEDSDPYLARQYVASAPVDFLVNISNDGWFDGTEEHEQHLAICRFRAIEARRAVVRAVNMGISAVIDPDGRILAVPGDTWGTSKKMEAVLTAVVPIDSRVSWYARLGDWLPAACWGLLVAGHFLAVWRRRKAV